MVTPKNIISNVCSKIKSNYEFEEGFVGMKMDDIKHVQLSEIAELITKGTTPTTLGYEFQDSGVNFLKIECLDENGVFIKSKVAHISEECHEKLKRSQLKDGDILFSIAGAIGRVAIVTEEMLPANTNQALAIIRITNEEVYLPYIKLILTSTIVKDQFEKKKQGVAQLNLSLKDINEISIPLPNIEKQIELAELFGKVANVIAKRNEEIKSLDELIKARFVELFGECNSYEKLENADVIISDGNYSSKYPTADEFVGDGVPFIRASNMVNNTITDEEMYFISKEKHAELLKGHVKPYDVLIATRGAGIGKIAVVPERHNDSNINAQIVLLRCNFKEYNPLYLSWYLKLQTTQMKIQGLVSGSAQPQLPIKRLIQLELLKPEIEMQNQFADFVRQVDKSKFNDMITEDYYSRENSRCRNNVFSEYMYYIGAYVKKLV